MTPTRHHIAVLIPCFNEAQTIAKVVGDFRKVLPEASIYVYDNNSNDSTIDRAIEAGAIVRREAMQGKGYVVRRMFADVDADIYVLVDGDDTYDASVAPEMIRTLMHRQCDMLNIARTKSASACYRTGHEWGNWMLSSLVRFLFSAQFSDMLSGYRIFSRRFVKSFPSQAKGFEIETELTVHSLELQLPVTELFAPYNARPEGSLSKLDTYRDGLRILVAIVRLLKNEKPFALFLGIGLVSLSIAGLLSIPLIDTYLTSGLVPRLPTAFGIVGLIILSGLSIVCGWVLESITHGRREIRRLFYLLHPAPPMPGHPAP